MSKQVEYINSVEKLKDILEERTLARYTEGRMAVFRGHADFQWQLEPSGFRNGNLAKEASSYEKYIKDSGCSQFNTLSPFEILQKMQHYNKPTRLLDCTIDPYVAAYFACCATSACDNVDGEIIELVMPFVEEQAVPVRSISYYAQYDFDENDSTSAFFDNLRIHLNYNYSNGYLMDALSEVYGVVPAMNNDRILRQKGCFLIFGENLEVLKKKHIQKSSSTLDNGIYSLKYIPASIKKYRIAANIKKEILYVLEKEKGYNEQYLMCV